MTHASRFGVNPLGADGARALLDAARRAEELGFDLVRPRPPRDGGAGRLLAHRVSSSVRVQARTVSVASSVPRLSRSRPVARSAREPNTRPSTPHISTCAVNE
jgi:hypothetical protein